jgi:gamma-glutamylcyclotransferase (GGCT)/AIG2-like uncharacterized protein YtfP
LRFFFYGTLIDSDVRRAVMGARPHSVEPATLKGWRCVTLPGVTYPTIVRDPDAVVGGLLARGLDATAKRRLQDYEEAEYELIELDVAAAGKSQRALVFVAPHPRPRIDWDYDTWRRRHKPRWMARFRAAHAQR